MGRAALMWLRVMPGSSWTMVMRRPTMRLNNATCRRLAVRR